ncbi:MAG TPA: PA2778 family cysteine peptidase [Steroidobacteraceae bacterium]|nr:PA2778 family cysteine peptidase [Steroidobacteraceae bacterium]
MIRAALPTAALLVGLAGCAASPPLAHGIPLELSRALELRDTPFFPQEDYQCGPAALATVLQASGIAVEPTALAPQVYLPKRRGSLQAELIGATRRHGRLAYQLPGTGQALLAELSEGRPVLLLQNLRVKALPVWHYAVLVGYDADRNVAVLRSGRHERLEMRWQSFARSWDRAGRWAISALAPGVIPAGAEASRYLEAAAGVEAAGDRRAAALAYDAAIARWPEEPVAWLGRGNVAYGDRDLAAAADAYARAATLAPDNAAVRNNLAQVLAEAGCMMESRRQLERAAALDAGSALAPVIEATRAEIEADARPGGTQCVLADRHWPD